MGYYTDYKIVVEGQDDSQLGEIFNRLEELSGYGDFYRGPVGNTVELDSVKFYECESVMRKLSAEYINVLFTVYGDGEEGGDLWVAYYKDGKGTDFMKPTIIYPFPMEDEFK